MKTITLKVYKEEIAGRNVYLTTFDLLRTAINQPVQGGFSIDEMQIRLRLLGIIDPHKETFTVEGEPSEEFINTEVDVTFEDADFEKLKALFKETKWGVVSSSIIDVSKQLQ